MSTNDQPNSGKKTTNRSVLLFAGVVALLLIVIAAVGGWKFSRDFAPPLPQPPTPPRDLVVPPEPPASAASVAASAPVPTNPASAPDAGASAAAPNAEASAPAAATTEVPPAAVKSVSTFTPQGARDYPEGPMGDMVRRGEQIFLHTGANAKAYVGNSLNCVNCHLDAGRLAHSAPMWAAYVLYPAYRSKTKEVDTFEERLRGCFKYSMNGKAPPDGDEVLVALTTYAYWMAKGAPTGEKLPGAGYLKLPEPAQAPDFERGRTVYAANCALCHGPDGQGQRSGGEQVFPPLWGPRSFNWGAGMAGVNTAAGFIKANMPLSKGNSLSDQDAWDVAYFMDGHERPQDPRFDGNIASTRKKFHDSKNSLYGQTIGGKLLGQGGAPPKR